MKYLQYFLNIIWSSSNNQFFMISLDLKLSKPQEYGLLSIPFLTIYAYCMTILALEGTLTKNLSWLSLWPLTITIFNYYEYSKSAYLLNRWESTSKYLK